MKRVALLTGVAAALAIGSIGHAQEIDSFDNPDTIQYTDGPFYWSAQYASWDPNAHQATFKNNATSWEVSSTGGYGSAYKSIYAEDDNTSIDISASNALRLDVTLVTGNAGLIIDVQDGEGDRRTYQLGFGLTGTAANDQGALAAGETITQGAAANELILTIPYTSYSSQSPATRNPAPGGFDYAALVNFNIEDDPGSTPTYDLAINDLSGVVSTTPEPASLSLLAAGGLLAARRRRA